MTLHVAIAHAQPHNWFLGSLSEIGIALLRREVPHFGFRNKNADRWELLERDSQHRTVRVITSCQAASFDKASTALYEHYARHSESHTVLPALNALVSMRGEPASTTIAKTFLANSAHTPQAVTAWINVIGLHNPAFRCALIRSLAEDHSILPAHASQLMDALLPEAMTNWYLPSPRELATLMSVNHPQLPRHGNFFTLEPTDDTRLPTTLDLRAGTTRFCPDLEPAGVLLAKRLTPMRDVCHATDPGRFVTIEDGLYDRYTGLTWQWAATEMLWNTVVDTYLPAPMNTPTHLNWAALGPSIQWG